VDQRSRDQRSVDQRSGSVKDINASTRNVSKKVTLELNKKDF